MNYLLLLKQLIAEGYLVAASVTDMRTKTVPKKLLLFSGLAELALFAAEAAWLLLPATQTGAEGAIAEGIVTRLSALAPGVLLLLLHFFAKEQIGAADGLSLLILGMALSPAQVWMTLLASLFMAFLCAVGVLAVGRGDRKARLPFLPFLAAGAVLSMLLFRRWKI